MSSRSKSAPFHGVCHPVEDMSLAVDAGCGWVRMDVPYPWEGRHGQISPRYAKFKQRAEGWKRQGLKLMAITPYLRQLACTDAELMSEAFNEHYREVCRFQAEDLRGIAYGWQITNEQNLFHFRKPVQDEASVIPFMMAGAVGVAEGDPEAMLGVNMATGHEESAYRMYAMLYPEPPAYRGQLVEWDYVGMDAYYGTWEPGGPDDWPRQMERLHEACVAPVIVQEWGYASAGAARHINGVAAPGDPAFDAKSLGNKGEVYKWPHAWSDGHTPEVQAEYVRRVVPMFEDAEFVLGAFWFRWHDKRGVDESYGLIDVNGNPKPSYHAYRQAIRQAMPDSR